MDRGVELLAWALVLAACVGCLYLLASAWAVRRLLRRPVPIAPAKPPVSVLKPLCGEDVDLLDNLRSFCRQDYPAFQIVFGVADPGDPAIPVVRRLMAEFPAADLALVIDPRRRGRNLKVANLHNILRAARHDILVLADSDMRVAADYLAVATAPLVASKAGLVTCLYRGVSTGGWWSDLGALHVNYGFLPQAALADALGLGAGCFGATIALGRPMLERSGGLAAIEDDLADDYALGEAVRRAGGRIEVSSRLVDTMVAERSLGALIRHELRWARTIRTVAPAGFAGSVLTHPVALALLAVLLGPIPGPAAAMLVLALACRWGSVAALDKTLGLPPAPVALVPVRDLLSFGVFVASFLARKVEWRDRNFRVARDGALSLDGDNPA